MTVDEQKPWKDLAAQMEVLRVRSDLALWRARWQLKTALDNRSDGPGPDQVCIHHKTFTTY
jgi:hypothetical protein